MSIKVKHRVEGVTIMELLVAILITSIVATASFWGYQFLMKSYAGNVEYKQKRLEEMQLASNISRMTQESESVVYNAVENSLDFLGFGSTLVFADDFVLIQNDRIDTIFVDCGNLRVEEVDRSVGRLVERFSFVLKSPIDSVLWEFSKEYSSDYLMSNGY